MKYAFLNCEAAGYSYAKGDRRVSSGCEVILSDIADGGKCYTVMPRGRQKNCLSRKNLDAFYDKAKHELADCFAKLIDGNKCGKVLIVGLGNRTMTADALGNKVISLLKAGGKNPHFSLIAPQVSISTGIDSSDVVQGVAERTYPDMIVLVDTLATAYYSRLGACYQVTNRAISPGSGVGNTNNGYGDLPCPVISVGAPLVISAGALGLDIDDAFTPADIDICVERCGNDIAYAISKAFNKQSGISQKY